MPKNIQKSLQEYISKIKTPRSPQFHIPTKKWIIQLKGCKHPRIPSFSIDNKNKENKKKKKKKNNNKNNGDEATLADIDRFLFENFKSLYLEDDEETNSNNNTKSVGVSSEEEEKEEEKTHEEKYLKHGRRPALFDSFEETPLDLYGYNKFFMTHGFSGSMTDTNTTTTNTCEDGSCSNSNSSTPNSFNINSSPKEDQMNIPDNCVVVLASSPSPYEDFRRSMQGMIDARLRNNQSVDWEFMEEILFCHFNLNEKKSYKFILSAFCDLVSVMRQSSETEPMKPRSVRTVRVGREVRKKTKEVALEFGVSR